MGVVAWALVRRQPVPTTATILPQAKARIEASRAAATPSPAPWSDAQRTRLRVALDAAFAPAIDGTQRYSLVVLDARGDTLYDEGAQRAVAPASAQKLIVASSALADLGATYRYHTLLAASGPIGSDGTLPGDLWLVGSGDPSFRSADLRRGIDTLAKAGLRRVAGGIAVDASAIRGEEINPHWDPYDANEDFQTPISGISLDEDTVEFDVTGGVRGSAAAVRVRPASRAIATSGSIVSGEGDDVVIAADATPNHFTLDGSVPTGVTEKFWVPVHGMPQYAAAVMHRMLRARGIEVDAPSRVEPAPLTSIVLWDHLSAPLRALERHMLFVSDNHYAEQLLRTVGGATGNGADDAGGIRAELAFLNRRGIPTPGLHLLDGSGLSAGNRIAAITLANVLDDAKRRGGEARLRLLLPAGGRQGTLAYYDFTTALGRVRAKTGHIDGVSSLAGYVDTSHHGRLVFAFLINDSPGDPDSAIVRAVNRLATM